MKELAEEHNLTAPSQQQHPLVPQQPLFAPQAAAVTGQLRTRPAACPVAADDAVAGNDDGNRITAVGRAHGAHGFGVANRVGNRLVTGRLAIPDAEKLLPDLTLKRRAVQGQGQVEAVQCAAEIGVNPFQDNLRDSSFVLRRQPPVSLPPAAPELARLFRRLSLSDVFLSFAGYRHPSHPVHRAIASLSAGNPLQVRVGANRWELLDGNGTVVGQLAGGFEAPPGMRCTDATVLAIATWEREHSEPLYQRALLCDAWEVVAPELVFEPDS